MSALPYYVGSGALVAVVAGAALYAPLKEGRLGWAGIPLGTALWFFTVYQLDGLSDLPPVVLAAGVAGLAGWRLPFPDSVLAIVLGPAIGALFISLLGGGADNPVPLVIAACTLAFTACAISSAGFAYVRRRRVAEAAHG